MPGLLDLVMEQGGLSARDLPPDPTQTESSPQQAAPPPSTRQLPTLYDAVTRPEVAANYGALAVARVNAQNETPSVMRAVAQRLPLIRSAFNFGDALMTDASEGRIAANNGTESDYARVASSERLRQFQAEMTPSENLRENLMDVPALLIEAQTAGRVLGNRFTPAAGATLGSRAANFAGQSAGTAGIMGTWLPRWTENNRAQGREALDLRGLPPAFAQETATMAVLGSLGHFGDGIGANNIGGFLQRGLARTALGMTEQAGLDVATSAIQNSVQNVFHYDLGFESGYGLIGQVARGERGEALANATQQALTFAVFAGVHEANRTPIMREYSGALRELRLRGMSGEEAGRRMTQVNDLVQGAIDRGLPRSEARTLLNEMAPEGPSRRYGESLLRSVSEEGAPTPELPRPRTEPTQMPPFMRPELQPEAPATPERPRPTSEPTQRPPFMRPEVRVQEAATRYQDLSTNRAQVDAQLKGMSPGDRRYQPLLAESKRLFGEWKTAGENLGRAMKASPEARQGVQTPEAAPRASEPLQETPGTPERAPAAATFTTARGSTYTVNENGTTTRNAVAQEGTSAGQQRPSERTIYVPNDVAGKLTGGGIVIEGNQAGKGRMNAKGEFVAKERVPFSETPAVGMAPVELYRSKNGGFQESHVGSPITAMQGGKAEKAPAVAEGRPVVAEAKPEVPAAPGTLFDQGEKVRNVPRPGGPVRPAGLADAPVRAMREQTLARVDAEPRPVRAPTMRDRVGPLVGSKVNLERLLDATRPFKDFPVKVIDANQFKAEMNNLRAELGNRIYEELNRQINKNLADLKDLPPKATGTPKDSQDKARRADVEAARVHNQERLAGLRQTLREAIKGGMSGKVDTPGEYRNRLQGIGRFEEAKGIPWTAWVVDGIKKLYGAPPLRGEVVGEKGQRVLQAGETNVDEKIFNALKEGKYNGAQLETVLRSIGADPHIGTMDQAQFREVLEHLPERTSRIADIPERVMDKITTHIGKYDPLDMRAASRETLDQTLQGFQKRGLNLAHEDLAGFEKEDVAGIAGALASLSRQMSKFNAGERWAAQHKLDREMQFLEMVKGPQRAQAMVDRIVQDMRLTPKRDRSINAIDWAAPIFDGKPKSEILDAARQLQMNPRANTKLPGEMEDYLRNHFDMTSAARAGRFGYQLQDVVQMEKYYEAEKQRLADERQGMEARSQRFRDGIRLGEEAGRAETLEGEDAGAIAAERNAPSVGDFNPAELEQSGTAREVGRGAEPQASPRSEAQVTRPAPAQEVKPAAEQRFGQPVREAERGVLPGGGQEAPPAPPAERPVARPEPPKAAIANASIDAWRENQGLPAMLSDARRADPVVWDRAMGILSQDPMAGERLVQQILDKPRSTTAEENALLLQRTVAARNERTRNMLQLIDAYQQRTREGGKEKVSAETSARIAQLENGERDLAEMVDRTDKATRLSGSEWGRAGRWRRMLLTEDFSLAGMLRSAEAAKGRELTEGERTDLAALHQKIADLQKKLDDAEASGKVKPGTASDEGFAVDQVRKQFKQSLERDREANAPTIVKAGRIVGEAVNLPRAIMASIDFPLLRQGQLVVASHPSIAMKAIPEMLKAFKSEEVADRALYNIRHHPDAAFGERSGLEITDRNASITAREEGFLARMMGKENIAEMKKTNKGLGTVAEVVTAVPRASERAYQTVMNRLRIDMFSMMVNKLGKGGKIVTDAEGRVIANYVNVMTGRGPLGAKGEKAAQLLSQVFFAPRWTVSRFQYILGQPLWTGMMSGESAPRARALVIKEYGRVLAGLGAALALAAGAGFQIVTDPRSTAFGQLQTGNTFLDMTGGLRRPAILLSRLYSGKTVNQFGVPTPIRGPNVPPRGSTVPSLIGDYLRSSAAPVPGAAINVAAGENVVGQPTSVKGELANMVSPLFVRDVTDAMKDLGVPRGTVASLLALGGMSMNTHNNQPQPPHPVTTDSRREALIRGQIQILTDRMRGQQRGGNGMVRIPPPSDAQKAAMQQQINRLVQQLPAQAR